MLVSCNAGIPVGTGACASDCSSLDRRLQDRSLTLAVLISLPRYRLLAGISMPR